MKQVSNIDRNPGSSQIPVLPSVMCQWPLQSCCNMSTPAPAILSHSPEANQEDRKAWRLLFVLVVFLLKKLSHNIPHQGPLIFHTRSGSQSYQSSAKEKTIPRAMTGCISLGSKRRFIMRDLLEGIGLHDNEGWDISKSALSKLETQESPWHKFQSGSEGRRRMSQVKDRLRENCL